MKFKIGRESAIHMGCSFDCSNNFILGNNSVINSNCRIDNRGSVIIGDNVSISNDVIILTADHDMNSVEFKGRSRKVIIADYVWIGTRALIMPGIKIGQGAVVAAAAVVTKDIDDFSVVAGVPARTIKKRSSNLNYKLTYRRLFQ